MEPLTQKQRIIALIINILVAWFIYILSTNSFFPTGSGSSIWLLSVIAYWLLVLVATPFFFSPPKDSLGTAISVILLLVPLDFSRIIYFKESLTVLNYATIGLSIFVASAALFSIFSHKGKNERFNQVCYRLSNTLGKGEVLLTLAVIISVLGFYQSDIKWIFIILGLWTFMVVARPIELFLKLFLYLKGYKKPDKEIEPVGTILRIDDPNIIRVNLSQDSSSWKPEIVHIAHLPNGRVTYVLPLFVQMQQEEITGTGLCCPIPAETVIPTGAIGTVHSFDNSEDLSLKLGCVLSGAEKTNKIAGIVVEGSSISDIRFQIVSDIPFEEGMVVFTSIRGKRIYYQILGAKTDEESFHQNPLGIHIVSASQLGSYDEEMGFKKFPWLPAMNQPVFLVSSDEVHTQKLNSNEFIIGKVPFTSFGIPVILNDLIEYHTAILGITGTGKTELALDIISNALDRGTKVFCVDFTGEYKVRLAKYNPISIGLDITQGSDLEKNLFAVETGTYGAPAEKAALKTFLDNLKPQVASQIETFINNKDQGLGIFELTEITNTKATLRTTELYLSAIMDWARKNRKAKQILIVLEEAHTIIPEVFSSGFDSDTQWVVGRIGQIALQGRKYGVGLLIVSQRTALVSKTVLSQCNTYFTHALIDKTSLEYLGNIYNSEHVKAIPNLSFLEFLAHGKGVKSERPLLLKRDYDESKATASKAMDVQKNTPVTEEIVEETITVDDDLGF